jgi:hypothetical protein
LDGFPCFLDLGNAILVVETVAAIALCVAEQTIGEAGAVELQAFGSLAAAPLHGPFSKLGIHLLL